MRDKLGRAARSTSLLFIELKAFEWLTRERLENKQTDSDADFAVYRVMVEEWEPMTRPHLILYSTNDNIEDLLFQARSYLLTYKRPMRRGHTPVSGKARVISARTAEIYLPVRCKNR